MAKNTVSFSVVIPAYNEEVFIQRALDSVLKQTCQPEEIIVVDDGSTDQTSEVAKRLAPQAKIIRQMNMGLAAARNAGISASSNEFIAFLDSDDEWSPQHLENARSVLVKYPELIWYCASFERRSESGETLYVNKLNENLLKGDVVTDYFQAQASHSFSNASTIIIKRKVFESLGGFSLEIKKFGEDLDMWFRIALENPQIGYCRSPGGVYWVRSGSITSNPVIDVPRFLERIDLTGKHLKGKDVKVRKKAEVLMRKWVSNAIRFALKQGDRDVLNVICKKQRDRIPAGWYTLCLLGRVLPTLLPRIIILRRRLSRGGA